MIVNKNWRDRWNIDRYVCRLRFLKKLVENAYFSYLMIKCTISKMYVCLYDYYYFSIQYNRLIIENCIW